MLRGNDSGPLNALLTRCPLVCVNCVCVCLLTDICGLLTDSVCVCTVLGGKEQIVCGRCVLSVCGCGKRADCLWKFLMGVVARPPRRSKNGDSRGGAVPAYSLSLLVLPLCEHSRSQWPIKVSKTFFQQTTRLSINTSVNGRGPRN